VRPTPRKHGGTDLALRSFTLGLNPVSGKARSTVGILDAAELGPPLRPLVDAFLADPNMDWQEGGDPRRAVGTGVAAGAPRIVVR
jgi:hypothetical protein